MDAQARVAAWDQEHRPECAADVPLQIKEELAEGHFEPDRPPGQRGLVDADVAAAVEGAIGEFRTLGATTVPVELPNVKLSVPVYYVLAPAEASSNLSRFDGVRYGHRAKEYGDLLDMYKKSRAEGFGAEVKRRILTGTYVLSHGYYDAYYLKAQKVRRL